MHSAPRSTRPVDAADADPVCSPHRREAPRPGEQRGAGALFISPQSFLPRGVRCIWALVATGALGVVVVLGVHFHDTLGAEGIDLWIWQSVGWSGPVHSQPLSAIADLVSAPAVVGCAAAAAALAAVKRRWDVAVLAVLAPGVTGAAGEGVKVVVHRSIWVRSWLAFPSGHTAGVTSLLVVGLLVALRARRQSALRIFGGLAVVALAASAVGASLAALGAHYPTDALGGFCLALACTIACAGAVDLITAKRGRRRTPHTSNRRAGTSSTNPELE